MKCVRSVGWCLTQIGHFARRVKAAQEVEISERLNNAHILVT